MNETSVIECDKSESEVNLLQWQVNSWSFDWVDQRTEQALLHTCSRHEWNKLYWMQ